MSLSVARRFAARELRGGLRGFRILLACLALGVAAIAAVGTVRASIEAGLKREGAAILGGDAEIRLTYRAATEAEREWIDSASVQSSEVFDFRSMAVVDHNGQAERGLTQIKAVDAAYPLMGQVGLDPEMPLSEVFAGVSGLPGAAMDRVLMDRLGLSAGDTFRLGTQDFVLMATLTREPDSAASGFSLGPRTLVRSADLANSSLLGPGSLYETLYRMDLAPEADFDTLEREAKAAMAESGMRWTDARNGAPGVATFVRRLGAFLVLVGLSGLAVGGIGVSAAVRAYLAGKTSVIATLRALGADRTTIFQTYFLQIGAVALVGIIFGVTLGAVVPMLFAPLIEARLPVPAEFALHPRPLIEAALYGLLTAFIFTLWPLARAEDIRAATLFRDALASGRQFPAARYVVATALALAALVALAGWFNGNWLLTLWTFGGLAGAVVMLILAATLLRALAKRTARGMTGRPRLRWALAAIAGPREGTASVVISLGLGLAVLAAVGQIDGNLRQAIAGNLPSIAPSYFFVDIQKDQMPGYSERLAGDPAVSNVQSAPMLRGVVTRINDQPAREVGGDHWVLTGDRGITYAETPSDGTIITEGEWWPENYSGPPQISFAQEEADEIGLSLGDTITLNILGRDITGTITSFREVDFSNAGMGFVMTMNPAALAGAPHTYISTVYAEPDAEAQILRDLAGQFPNITAIRVRDAIDRVSDVLGGLAAATSYGAAATLLTGFLVLIGAAAAGTPARVYEAAVLKTLGATRRTILTSFIWRAALTGLAAGGVALLAGIAGGWAVSHFVMETRFAVIWPSALLIVTGGVLATVLAGLAFAWGPLNARPAQVLRARE